jgi:hypothetical protein
MLTRAAVLIAIALVLPGCAGAASAPLPTASSPPASPPSSPTPIRLAPVGSGPAILHEAVDAGFVLGAAAIEVDGVAHLWAVAFRTEPDIPPDLVHLTSDDGTTWEAGPEPVRLDATALGVNDIGPIPSSVLIDGDGTWLLYGGARRAGSDAPIVWRATSPGPDGPWTVHPEPVLTPSADGWDSAITDHPSVLRTDDGYLMAYGGAGGAQPNRNRIGFARSPDGIAWTRIPATLPAADDGDALGPVACGIDARTMFEPELVRTDGGLRLLFGAMVDDDMFIGAADSPDGRTWTCAAEGALLEPADFGGPGTGLHSYVLVRDDPNGMLLVEVLSDGASDLWRVLPDDGG